MQTACQNVHSSDKNDFSRLHRSSINDLREVVPKLIMPCFSRKIIRRVPRGGPPFAIRGRFEPQSFPSRPLGVLAALRRHLAIPLGAGSVLQNQMDHADTARSGRQEGALCRHLAIPLGAGSPLRIRDGKKSGKIDWIESLFQRATAGREWSSPKFSNRSRASPPTPAYLAFSCGLRAAICAATGATPLMLLPEAKRCRLRMYLPGSANWAAN